MSRLLLKQRGNFYHEIWCRVKTIMQKFLKNFCYRFFLRKNFQVIEIKPMKIQCF